MYKNCQTSDLVLIDHEIGTKTVVETFNELVVKLSWNTRVSVRGRVHTRLSTFDWWHRSNATSWTCSAVRNHRQFCRCQWTSDDDLWRQSTWSLRQQRSCEFPCVLKSNDHWIVCIINSDVSSRTSPWPQGASRTQSSGLGLGLEYWGFGLGLGLGIKDLAS